MEATSAVRADRWLWAVRLYKTRSLACAACNAGHVRVNGHPCKPARPVRAGDVLSALTGEITRTVKVLAVLENRIGAKLVRRYLEDLTPPAEYEKSRGQMPAPTGQRPKGAGRPTKKDRRLLGSFFGLDD
jgi:ribosome-associated heat shock protein Hsp15